MRMDTMRKFDDYIGPFVCTLLTVFMFLKEFFPSRHLKKDKDIKKILVIKFWGMGSIVLSTPTLRAIKKRFPHAEMTFLTLKQNKSICESISYIDRILCLEVERFTVFLRSFTALAYLLGKNKFDIVIDFEFFTNFSSIITFLTRTECTIGFHTAKFWRTPFYKKGVAFDHTKHIVDIFLKMSQALGVTDSKDITIEAPVISDETRKVVRGMLYSNKILKEDYVVCININTSSLSEKRRLPMECFAEIVKWLLDYPQVQTILIGSKEDTDYVLGFLKRINFPSKIINFCGKTTIKELVALLEQSDLFIGNDSGPLHLAVAVGIKTISFFGPETPNLYGPRGNNHLVFYNDLYCSPCLNVYELKKTSRNCGGECLKEIRASDVINAIEKFINH